MDEGVTSSKHMRVSPKFYSDIEKVVSERIMKGKDRIYDKKPSSRITEGISRHPLFRTKILPDLCNADMPKLIKPRKINNKGFSPIIGIFIGLVAFIILAFIFAVGSGLLMKVSSTLTSSVIDSAPQATNFKNTTIITAGNVNSGVQQLNFFSWIFIVAMALGVLISAYMVKPSGLTLFFWFLLSSGIFLAGIYISRAYEDLYHSTGFVGDALHLTASGTSWLIIYMPHIIVLLAFIGGIILYMRMNKQEDDAI